MSSAHSARVLIVDDELRVRKMLTALLSQAAIRCSSVAGAEEALHVLESEPIDAVISDLRMCGASGMDLLAKVHSKYPEVAFLMATGVNDVRVGVQAMKQGADDYLVKPFDIDLVLASLERALGRKALEREVENYRRHLEEMVRERTQQLEAAIAELGQSYTSTLEALGSAIDLRDGPTAGHSRRVLCYSLRLAERIGGLDDQRRNLAMGAWLHDIGKLAIPDGILLKPGTLSDEEREVMKRHVEIGYDLVRGIPFIAEAAETILAHHERYDGSGYPRKLRGEHIPICSRIFAVADSFDAMTSDRPYRSARPFRTAADAIKAGSGTLFDPNVVSAFLAISQDGWEAIRRESSRVSMPSILGWQNSSSIPQPTIKPSQETILQLPTERPVQPQGASCQAKHTE